MVQSCYRGRKDIKVSWHWLYHYRQLVCYRLLPFATRGKETSQELKAKTVWICFETRERVKEDQLEMFSDYSFNDKNGFVLLRWCVTLRFNEGRKYCQDSPRRFPPWKEAWEHFLLDHISRKYPLMSLTKPKKENILPSCYRSKGEAWRKIKRREDMLRRQLRLKAQKKSC